MKQAYEHKHISTYLVKQERQAYPKIDTDTGTHFHNHKLKTHIHTHTHTHVCPDAYLNRKGEKRIDK